MKNEPDSIAARRAPRFTCFAIFKSVTPIQTTQMQLPATMDIRIDGSLTSPGMIPVAIELLEKGEAVRLEQLFSGESPRDDLISAAREVVRLHDEGLLSKTPMDSTAIEALRRLL